MTLPTILNDEGGLTDLGRPWTRGTVHQVLTNEKYIGNNVYNRISFKLKKKRVVNPPDMWIRGERRVCTPSSIRRCLTLCGGSSKSAADDSR